MIYYPKILSAHLIGRTRSQLTEFYQYRPRVMVERYSMLRSACSGPRGEELRPLRRRKSGSETPELQSMSCEESQKLRSLEGQPRVAERGGEHRSQRLHVPVRHGLKFWSLRPRLPTARCSHFPPPWPGTCRTRRRRSCAHRNTAEVGPDVVS